jgi:hypothetical protein
LFYPDRPKAGFMAAPPLPITPLDRLRLPVDGPDGMASDARVKPLIGYDCIEKVQLSGRVAGDGARRAAGLTATGGPMIAIKSAG